MQVYSEVKGTLRVEVYDTTGASDILVNEVLVKEGYAVRCEEPYQSRVSVQYVICRQPMISLPLDTPSQPPRWSYEA